MRTLKRRLEFARLVLAMMMIASMVMSPVAANEPIGDVGQDSIETADQVQPESHEGADQASPESDESTDEGESNTGEVLEGDVSENEEENTEIIDDEPAGDDGSGFVAPLAASDFPQSTNAGNLAKNWPHVRQLNAEQCGPVTLELYSSGTWTAGVSYFEILVDGVSWNGWSSPNHIYLGDGIAQYGGISVSNSGTGATIDTRSFNGTEVQVRHALGAEQDAYFDWVTFTSEPCLGTANITITKNYPEVTLDLPSTATWTITNRDTGVVVASGTTGGPFPVTFSVPNLPYGNYTFELQNLGPQFKTATSGGASLVSTNFTLNGPTVNVSRALQLTAMGAFYPLRSTNGANMANGQAHVVQLEDATCGEVSLLFNNPTALLSYFEILVDGEPWNGYMGGPHEVVPNDVQYGGLNVWGSEATGRPIHAPHTQSFAGEEVRVRFALGSPGTAYFDWVTFTSEPCGSEVTINLVSSDPAIANELPAGSTWTVTQGDTVIATDTFAAEHLTLPASIVVNSPVPFGTYTISINAGPTFNPLENYDLVVSEPTHEFQVELSPVVAPAVYDGQVNVVEESGGPVSGAEVTLVETSQTATTGSAGSVSFESLENGTYSVTVTAADGRTASGSLVINNANASVTVTLPPVEQASYVVTFEVVDADEQTPIAGAALSITSNDDDAGAAIYGVIGAQRFGGLFQIAELPTLITGENGQAATPMASGSYSVSVLAPDGRTATASFVVGAEDTTVRIVLQAEDDATPTPPTATETPAPVTGLPETGSGAVSGFGVGASMLMAAAALGAIGLGVLRQTSRR